VARIVLIRHGQTDLSLRRVFCGSADPPLNAVGLEMAEALGAQMSPESGVALYVSPLLRTRQTAAPVARCTGLTAQVEPGLREISYGEWEARPSAEIRQVDDDRYQAWNARPGELAPPGGETGRAVAARAVPAVQAIVDRHPDGTSLIVSHKTTIRIIVCSLLGIDLNLFRARLDAPLTSRTVIEFRQSGPYLTSLGDVSHLPPHLQQVAAEGG
jgi:broad specificity phosphatase PhoE